MISAVKYNTNSIELLGIGLVKILGISSKREIEIIFQKGIGIQLIRNIINKNIEKILTKKEGILIDIISNFTLYIHYFYNEQDEIICVIYLDKKEKILNFSELYNLSRQLYDSLCQHEAISTIKDICYNKINIPKFKGVLALFIIGIAGHLLLSKINKEEKKLIECELPISGFISAILTFSREMMRKEPGITLRQINFGNQNFYLNIKKNAIFAYLIERGEIPKTFKRYMQIISDEFIEKFDTRIELKNFNGELTQFFEFEEVIDQYFII